MLRIAGLHKAFYDPGRGPTRAVDGIDLAADGGVVALVGANGAGKTTLLRLIATLLRPDAGSIAVAGHDALSDPRAVRRHIGLLTTATRLYPRLSAREVLAYAGGFYGLRGDRLAAAIDRMRVRFALDDFLDQRCDGLSTGQAQRVNIARTMLADPPLLILDEPTTGLDIAAARQMVEAIRAVRSPDRLVIFATHIMTEVDALADRLLIMDRGRLAYDGQPGVLGTGAALVRAVFGYIGASAPDAAETEA
ncbi:MAG: ATP-binding cassette domain-containing protein [Planctomycetota bacterium]